MAEITSSKWSFQDPGDAVPDDSIIAGGNFTQLIPDTPIMVGKPLTIRGGNFTNVRRDPSWTIEGGNFAQVFFCANLRPDLVDKGLPAEPENCSHVVDTDEIVGGATVYHYKHGKV